jgi:hypothetical protein
MTMPPGPGAARAARTACRTAAGTAGLLGSLACGASMVAAAAGAGGSAAAAGMAAMSGRGATAHGLLGVLLRAGPGLLIASVLLVTAAFALRRLIAAGGALLAGAVLYGGMYGQSSPAVMYASFAVGYPAWAGLYLWTRTRPAGRQAGGREDQRKPRRPKETIPWPAHWSPKPTRPASTLAPTACKRARRAPRTASATPRWPAAPSPAVTTCPQQGRSETALGRVEHRRVLGYS